MREGFDPTQTEDAIYFNDPERKVFVRLDTALHERICAGAIRL